MAFFKSMALSSVLLAATPAQSLELVTGPGLDLQQVEGTWYTLATNFPKPYACNDSTISLSSFEADGRILINETYRMAGLDSPELEANMVGWLSDEFAPREWIVEFKDEQADANFFIRMMDRDYQVMAVTNKSKTLAWVLSKDESLPSHEMQWVKDQLFAMGAVSGSSLRLIEQKNCR